MTERNVHPSIHSEERRKAIFNNGGGLYTSFAQSDWRGARPPSRARRRHRKKLFLAINQLLTKSYLQLFATNRDPKNLCSNFAVEIKPPPCNPKGHSLMPINRQSEQPTLLYRVGPRRGDAENRGTSHPNRRKGKNEDEHIHEFCEQEKCSCKDGIWVSALKHTLKIIAIIYIVSVLLDFAVSLVPHETLVNVLNFPVLSQIASALFGLIPSCAVSATLSQLYIDSALGISPLLCGLLTNGGVGLLVLFRVNRNLKNNIFIVLTVFLAGLVFGSLAGFIL